MPAAPAARVFVSAASHAARLPPPPSPPAASGSADRLQQAKVRSINDSNKGSASGAPALTRRTTFAHTRTKSGGGGNGCGGVGGGAVGGGGGGGGSGVNRSNRTLSVMPASQMGNGSARGGIADSLMGRAGVRFTAPKAAPAALATQSTSTSTTTASVAAGAATCAGCDGQLLASARTVKMRRPCSGGGGSGGGGGDEWRFHVTCLKCKQCGTILGRLIGGDIDIAESPHTVVDSDGGVFCKKCRAAPAAGGGKRRLSITATRLLGKQTKEKEKEKESTGGAGGVGVSGRRNSRMGSGGAARRNSIMQRRGSKLVGKHLRSESDIIATSESRAEAKRKAAEAKKVAAENAKKMRRMTNRKWWQRDTADEAAAAAGAPVWKLCKTKDGDEYYYNAETRETTYEKPMELMSDQVGVITFASVNY
jgi:hypothetical protein